MSRRRGPFAVHNPWAALGALGVAALLAAAFVFGFLWLPATDLRADGARSVGWWAAVCRGFGLVPDGSDKRPGAAPPARAASELDWDAPTLRSAVAGDAGRGAFVAVNCAACHGPRGVSAESWLPNLAGMDPAVIFKQLADYRAGKRRGGVMNAVAQALSEGASADVAAYYAALARPPAPAAAAPSAYATRRLVYAGDPIRHVAACAACHGPGGRKAGAPVLAGQHPDYLERQLGEFAEGSRANDLNRQMRLIASELTPPEMHALAEFLAGSGGVPDPNAPR